MRFSDTGKRRDERLDAMSRLEQMDVVDRPENTTPKGSLDRLEDLEAESNHTRNLEGDVYEAVGDGLDKWLSENGVKA